MMRLICREKTEGVSFFMHLRASHWWENQQEIKFGGNDLWGFWNCLSWLWGCRWTLSLCLSVRACRWRKWNRSMRCSAALILADFRHWCRQLVIFWEVSLNPWSLRSTTGSPLCFSGSLDQAWSKNPERTKRKRSARALMWRPCWRWRLRRVLMPSPWESPSHFSM